MKKNAIAIACTAVLALALCVPFLPSPASSPSADVRAEGAARLAASPDIESADGAEGEGAAEDGPFGGADYVPGVALVTFADEAVDSQAALDKLAEDTGIEGLSIAERDAGYVQLSIPGDIATDEAIERIRQSSVVDAVQPNFVYHIVDDGAGTFLAPRASLDFQAGTIRLNTQATIDDDPDGKLWHLNDSQGIDAYGAWDVVKNKNYVDASDGSVTKKRVTVAIMDNCFDVSHEDLKNNVVDAYSATDVPASNIGDSRNVTTSYHGTHVAGIIGAQANNGTGVAGVSYNAQVLPVRVCDSNGGITTDYLVKAYRYILGKERTYNIRVINLSIGGGRTSLEWSTSDNLLFRQIDAAYERNIVTVTAACNADGKSGSAAKEAPFYAFPADYSKCVSVISVDKDRERTSNSNYNKDGQTTKDVSAPGKEIYSTTPGGYGYSSGTSMAAPVVAGTLALMFAKDSSLTADEAVNRLYSTATDLGEAGWDAQTGFGLVNAHAAVTTTAILSGGKAVKKGGQTTLKATGIDGALTWKSSDPGVATVSSSGVVTGVSCGSAEVSVTDAAGTTTLRQMMTVYDPTILSDTEGFAIADGEAVLHYLDKAQVKVADGQPAGVWTWSSSDPDAVSVGSETGALSVKKASATPVKITVTLGDDPSISESISVRAEAVDIEGATIALSPSSFVYSGEACKPTVSSVRVGGRLLAGDVDYQVSGYSDNVEAGEGKVTILGLGNYQGTATASFSIYKTQEEQLSNTATEEGGSMYRLYNPYTGEHFYTASVSECSDVMEAGWTYEGVGWTAPSSGDEVYRLYNRYGEDHHYTLSESERDELVEAGWTYEGVGWYSDADKSVPLFREYNPNMFSCNHNYTKDKDEHDFLVSLGWVDEDVAWYGV